MAGKAKRRDDGDESLGTLLRRLRQEAGVGIKSAGPELGVDYSYLSKIENGVVSPSAELLEKLAEYYEADSDSLFRAAGRIPPDVRQILDQHFDEAIAELRRRFGVDKRQR